MLGFLPPHHQTHARRTGTSAIACAALVFLATYAPAEAARRDAVLAQPGSPASASIVVSGHGRVLVTPDRATLSTGVSTQEKTAAEAMQSCAREMQKVVSAIKGVGIPDNRVQTSRISLSPVHERYDGGTREPKVIGYRAENTVQVQIDDLSTIGALVDSVVKAGANSAFGISFSREQDKAERGQALEGACQDAAAKARTIAEALGGTLGDVLEVNESGVQTIPFRPMPMDMAGFARAESFSTPIALGEIAIEGSVTIRYAFRAR